jgi:hypothetical protein
MPTISETISLTNTDQNAQVDKQVIGAAFGAMIACLLFSVPLGLIYRFFYHNNVYWFRNILLFFAVYLLACVINLLFYRVVIMNDQNAQIDKMGSNDVGFVMTTTFAGFFIVALTLIGLSANPLLVQIFENTIGYWLLQYFELRELTDEVFSSKTMDPIKDNAKSNEFDYSFLITRFNLDNLEELIEYGKNCKGNRDSAYLLGLDFNFILEYDEQEKRVRDMVHLKNTIGHYIWVYLSSVVALIVSMIAVIM